MAEPVTYLFVPGDRPDRFAKALASGADAVILDLEDAVDPDGKDAARQAIAGWFATLSAADRVRVLVRINDATTSWFAADLAFALATGVSGLMLPKAEDTAGIAQAAAALPPGGTLIPLIETARGLRAVDGIAAAPGVRRLAFGNLDFAVDLGLSGDERGLTPPALALALASRLAGRPPPVAGVTPDIDDEDALAHDLAWARAVGFGAKLCIHPRQIAGTRRGFAPTDAERDWARRVLAAAERGLGALRVDGRMVDRPVILKAQSILARTPS